MGTSKKQDLVQQPSAAPQQPAGNLNEGGIWPQPPQGSFSAQQRNFAGQEGAQNGAAKQRNSAGQEGAQNGAVQQRNPAAQEGALNGEQKDKSRKSKKADSEGVLYHGQKLKKKEFVNQQGFVVKKKKTGKRRLAEHIAAHLAVCLCCAYVCTAPCCCGL